ncbi:GTP-binding protein EngB [Halodesulfurarchaeum sp.]|uniref:GTP-binding protein EngB n=1 Tax=Halodesulfurarchaeum sp. TaxID=1980530 RepID=UPI002FC39FD9
MFDTRPDRSREVVLVGRSNVGKSTLMRELTGHSFNTGRSPGVTRSPNHYDWASEDFMISDLPGFGFMSGVAEETREQIKTDVVQYLEAYADQILVGVLVLDGKAAVDIIDRHTEAGNLPHVVEFFSLLEEFGIQPVVAVNKIDKVDTTDKRLDEIAERLGMMPPWTQWQDVIAPISAKQGRIKALEEAVCTHLEAERVEELKQFFT